VKAKFDLPVGTDNAHVSWSGFARVSMLMRWASELKEVITRPEKECWPLVGRTAMIVHHEPEVCREMARCVAWNAGMKFVDITASDFLELFSGNPDVSLELICNKQPAMVYVPQGDWSQELDRKSDPNCVTAKFQDVFPEILRSMPADFSIVFVTSGADYGELTPTLRVKGGFDRRFVVPKFSSEEIGRRFLDRLGRKLCDPSLLAVPEKVGTLLEIEFEDLRRQGLIEIAMQRLAWREKRLVKFSDLVDFAANGSAESDQFPTKSAELSYRVAVHEAGHAVIAMLDSQGLNIPDYASIVSNHLYMGLVSDSYAYHHSQEGHIVYRNSRHKVRVALAGRAAEEFVLGKEDIATWGSRSDLVDATLWAKEIIGMCGFPADLDAGGKITNNLAVISGDGTVSEHAHIESQVRIFLASQYEAISAMLGAHRKLLNRIVENLLAERILGQSDLLALYLESN
jgi:hypothetical protein